MHGHEHVRDVHHLGDVQIAGHGTQRVGFVGIHPALMDEIIDHVAGGLPGRLVEGRGERGNGVVLVGLILGLRDRAITFAQVQLEHDPHRRLDGRAADLAESLRRVRVTDGEQRPFDENREVDRRARRVERVVHVAAVGARRDGRQQLVGVRSDPHDSGKRSQRHLDACGELDPVRPGLDLPGLEVRLRELVRQQPEPREDPRPAPLPDLDLVQGHRQHVSRSGPLDVDRTGQRVDGVHADGGEVLCGRAGVELSVGGFLGKNLDDRAWRNA